MLYYKAKSDFDLAFFVRLILAPLTFAKLVIVSMPNLVIIVFNKRQPRKEQKLWQTNHVMT